MGVHAYAASMRARIPVCHRALPLGSETRSHGPAVELQAVKAHVADLKALLSKGSIVEQKSFLRSFIKRIKVSLPRIVVDYTIPLVAGEAESATSEVLSMGGSGTPGRIRTCDPGSGGLCLIHLATGARCVRGSVTRESRWVKRDWQERKVERPKEWRLGGVEFA